MIFLYSLKDFFLWLKKRVKVSKERKNIEDLRNA